MTHPLHTGLRFAPDINVAPPIPPRPGQGFGGGTAEDQSEAQRTVTDGANIVSLSLSQGLRVGRALFFERAEAKRHREGAKNQEEVAVAARR